MKKVVELLDSNNKLTIIEKKIAEAKEVKGLWSTFGEFEIGFSNFEDIGSFCFEFMPSSIEIISPAKIELDSKEVEDFTNDVLAKLHQYDMIVKQMILKQRNESKVEQKD